MDGVKGDMINRRLLLILITIIAVLATGWSFVALNGERSKVPIERLDKAELVYSRAESFLKGADQEKAINAFITTVNQYSGSKYAEKALRKLASISVGDDDYKKANYYYKRLLKAFPEIKDGDQIRSSIDELNVKMIQSALVTEDSIEYVVQSGDTLFVIAKRFNTTVELIKKTNNLSNDIIRLGQKLKIIISKFSIFVDKSDNMLILKKDGEPFKTYMVSTGRNNSTPVGVFTVTDKMIKPPWTKPGVGIITADSDEYELGERWIAISAQGYGIHGTNDENSIGGQVTAGCVRMHNDEVIELYDIIPRGTEVEIID